MFVIVTPNNYVYIIISVNKTIYILPEQVRGGFITDSPVFTLAVLQKTFRTPQNGLFNLLAFVE